MPDTRQQLEWSFNLITTKPLFESQDDVPMKIDRELIEREHGEAGGRSKEARTSQTTKRRREEVGEDKGPQRGQERRDPVSRRQGRGVGK